MIFFPKDIEALSSNTRHRGGHCMTYKVVDIRKKKPNAASLDAFPKGHVNNVSAATMQKLLYFRRFSFGYNVVLLILYLYTNSIVS